MSAARGSARLPFHSSMGRHQASTLNIPSVVTTSDMLDDTGPGCRTPFALVATTSTSLLAYPSLRAILLWLTLRRLRGNNADLCVSEHVLPLARIILKERVWALYRAPYTRSPDARLLRIGDLRHVCDLAAPPLPLPLRHHNRLITLRLPVLISARCRLPASLSLHRLLLSLTSAPPASYRLPTFLPRRLCLFCHRRR